MRSARKPAQLSHFVDEAFEVKKGPDRRERLKCRAGFTLVELFTVLLLFGVAVAIAGNSYSAYLRRATPDRASRVVGTYVSLTRSYALQRRAYVTLAVDPVDLTLMIRSEYDTIRTMFFDADSDMPLDTLDTNLDGDSLTFDPRGVCSVCGVVGKSITVSANNTSYLITFNTMGRWKRTAQ